MRPIAITLLFGLLFFPCIPAGASGSPSQPSAATSLGTTPVAFTKNMGQWPDSILFRASAGGTTMWFTSDGIYYQYFRRVERTNAKALAQSLGLTKGLLTGRFDEQPDSIETTMIKAEFVGANSPVGVVEEGELSYKCNFFIGNNPAKWRTDVLSYSRIRFRGLYPGVDVSFQGEGNKITYEATSPELSNLSQVRVIYRGATAVAERADGSTTVETSMGIKTFDGILPVDETAPLPSRVTASPMSTNGLSLVYGTYLGGHGQEYGYGVAVDPLGNAYLTGYTSSSDFPTVAPYQTHQINEDVFVTKLSATGGSLIFSTYIGGSNFEVGNAIGIDASGSAYVTGTTQSEDFPTQSPFQPNLSGVNDAFVLKLSPSGNSLTYSTYLGGTAIENGWGVAVDSGNHAYVTGLTQSTNFPTVSPYQSMLRGQENVFVTKLSVDGSSLVYSTYVGGSLSDEGRAIAVDATGGAYVTGFTASTDYPTKRPIQTDPFDGDYDVFITKLTPAGNDLVYSTYLGGSKAEIGYAITVDRVGCAYLTGQTSSTNFPTKGPFQTNQPYEDAFVTKLSSGGDSLIYSTYLGGDRATESGQGIAVDGHGRAFVTGYTNSSNFPTKLPVQSQLGGTPATYTDAFVSELSASGSGLVFSTYLGGSDQDMGYGIALDTSGGVYVTGYAYSSDFPVQSAYQSTYLGGHGDVFVAKLAFVLDTFSVVASTGPNGTITPNGTARVPSGDSLTFVITPNPGYIIDVVQVDGSSVGAVSSYTFRNVSSDHTINVSFKAALAPSITSSPVTSGSINQAYSYTVVATGLPSPTYSLTIKPTGMTIDSLTGLIQWTPTAVGDYNVTAVASNVAGSANQAFVVHVNCCIGKRGNVNCTGTIDLGDLTALVSYLTGGGFALCCFDAANVNGVGTLDLGDLSALVSYLTGGGFVLVNCP